MWCGAQGHHPDPLLNEGGHRQGLLPSQVTARGQS